MSNAVEPLDINRQSASAGEWYKELLLCPYRTELSSAATLRGYDIPLS